MEYKELIENLTGARILEEEFTEEYGQSEYESEAVEERVREDVQIRGNS